MKDLLHIPIRKLPQGLWVFAFFAMAITARGQSTGFAYDLPGNLTNITQYAGSAPTVTLQPASQIISQNGTLYFSFEAAGPGQLSYQWLSNGVPIPGATGDTLAVTNIVVPVNLISNGSFEMPFIGESNLTALTFSAGQNFGGWTVESNTVDLIDTLWQAADGVQSVDMSGTSAGVIYQDVPTVPGQQYYLSFALAGNPTGGPAIKTNQVWWNGSLLDTVTFNTTGHSVTAMGWTNYQYLVTATSPTTRIQFASLIPGSAGPALDDVMLTGVPPPPPDYSVIVSNTFGSVTSAVAQVQFDVGPTNPAPLLPSLNLFATPGGEVAVSPVQQSYTPGELVQFTAVPDPGDFFLYWSGDLAGTNSPEDLIVNSNLNVAAFFGLDLINADTTTGTIPVAGTNFYGFTANAGDSIVLDMGRVSNGTSTFYPYLLLYGPGGALLGSDASGYPAATIAFRATNSGTFAVIAENNNGLNNVGNGTYSITLGKTGSPIVVAPGDQGGPLTNAFTTTGTLAAGQLEVWSFTANSGDNLVLDMGRVSSGTSTFFPYLRLYGPDGSLLASDPSGYPAAEVAFRATNSGTFTVIAANSDNVNNGGNGTYSLTLGDTGSPIVVAPGDQGGPLTNAFTTTGTVAAGQLEVWNFTANSGDNLVVDMGRVSSGTSTFFPYLQLYGPNGALLASDASSYPAANVAFRATNSGTFTVIALNNDNVNNGGNGTYSLTLGKTGSPIVVAPGDQGGPLTNAFTTMGTLAVGQLEVWSFTANSGDNLIVDMGRVSNGTSVFYPYLRLYGPDGSLLGSLASGYAAAEVPFRATNSGTFTVIAANSDNVNNGGNGTYSLTLADTGSPIVVAPGDQGGPLTNAFTTTGTVAAGQLEVWSFTANSGDNLVLDMGRVSSGTSTFYPYLQLYGPNGALLASYASGYPAANVAVLATNSGTFTVITANNDSVNNGGNGTYSITLGKTGSPIIVAPGDQGGPLTNGFTMTGNLAVGQLEVWSFVANSGDNLVLDMGRVSSGTLTFYPYLRLYGPNGALLGAYASGYPTANIALLATNSGTFTVIAANNDGVDNGGNGTCLITLGKTGSPPLAAPGDQGGSFNGSGIYTGTLATGELDVWQFTQCAGESITMQMTNTGSGTLYPYLRLYGPEGTLLDSVASDNHLASITTVAPAGGTYILMAANNDGWDNGGNGTFQLTVNGLSDGFKTCIPVITGTNVNISAVGGPPGDNAVLLTTTNLATPTMLWTPILTNEFNPYGVFEYTNGFDPVEPQHYFRLSYP